MISIFKGVNTMPVKLTVIVPVYNTDKYLEQCLESIIQQTYSNLQIICINDGSTDDSNLILQKYEARDKRIQLINQENKGYGAAVNKGFELACGEYVTIVESDDFIDPFTYESMVHIANRCKDVEIIKFAYWDYFDNPDGTHTISPSLSSKVETHLYPFKIEQFPELLIYHPSIWSCIYRRDFLNKHTLKLVEAPGAGWSDNPFFFSSMILAGKIIWTNEKHYFYRRTNPECSSNLKDCRIPFQRLIEIIAFIEKNNVNNPIILDYFYKRCLIYTQVVAGNENFDLSIMTPYITKVMSYIDPQKLQNNFYTEEERAMHTLFYKAKEKL